jgi:hypothetical protein
MAVLDQLSFAMAVDNCSREGAKLLAKDIPFRIEIAYDGLHLTTSIQELRPGPQMVWKAAAPKENKV